MLWGFLSSGFGRPHRPTQGPGRAGPGHLL